MSGFVKKDAKEKKEDKGSSSSSGSGSTKESRGRANQLAGLKRQKDEIFQKIRSNQQPIGI